MKDKTKESFKEVMKERLIMQLFTLYYNEFNLECDDKQTEDCIMYEALEQYVTQNKLK